MDLSERYPAMEHIFTTYFGQDFDLFGNTVPEIITSYKRNESYWHRNLIRELASFRSEHPNENDLEAAFQKWFRRGFRYEVDGYTTASFLDEIQRLLSE
ncbi:contact-dependent growth inhibition system immunity protein [Paraburkholderia youngii]|uniref:contact-dependent growth inhibition system immunity protein n=1 Tax=Paraburkholderia youngii TaxID=2782701 RepID=UPI003D24194E